MTKTKKILISIVIFDSGDHYLDVQQTEFIVTKSFNIRYHISSNTIAFCAIGKDQSEEIIKSANLKKEPRFKDNGITRYIMPELLRFKQKMYPQKNTDEKTQ